MNKIIWPSGRMRIRNIHCNYCVRCRCFVYAKAKWRTGNVKVLKAINLTHILYRKYGVTLQSVCVVAKRTQTDRTTKTNLQTKLIFYICFLILRICYPLNVSHWVHRGSRTHHSQIWSEHMECNCIQKMQFNTTCESNYWFYCFAVLFVQISIGILWWREPQMLLLAGSGPRTIRSANIHHFEMIRNRYPKLNRCTAATLI